MNFKASIIISEIQDKEENTQLHIRVSQNRSSLPKQNTHCFLMQLFQPNLPNKTKVSMSYHSVFQHQSSFAQRSVP